MDVFSWNLTVAGAILCLLYGWFLSYASRLQRSKTSRMGLVVSVVGIVVLAGMALAGPIQAPKLIRENEMQKTEFHRSPINFKGLHSVASKATKELGSRPSRNHVAYEGPSGKLAWVTTAEYMRLLTEKGD